MFRLLANAIRDALLQALEILVEEALLFQQHCASSVGAGSPTAVQYALEFSQIAGSTVFSGVSR